MGILIGLLILILLGVVVTAMVVLYLVKLRRAGGNFSTEKAADDESTHALREFSCIFSCQKYQ